jgi:hypothetical protein
MAKTRELHDVPDADLPEIIGDFESEGAAVTKIKQDDGLWTVRAVFADGATASTKAVPVREKAGGKVTKKAKASGRSASAGKKDDAK